MKFTLSKLFLFIVLLGILLFVIRPIEDPDFWWHLKTGQVISQTKQIPQVDSFSFTANGRQWITHEWLTEVIIFKLYESGSYNLVIIVFSILILLSFFLTVFRCDDRTNLYAVGSALLLGAIMATPVLWARPQIFTLLYTSAFLLLLDRFAENGKVSYLIPLPLLMLIWVNQHGAFIVGLGIIGIFILSRMIDAVSYIQEKKHLYYLVEKRIILLFCTLLLCTLVTFINPSGSKILFYPFQTLSDKSMQHFIVEWATPDFGERTWIPLLVMFLSLLGFGLKSKHQISTTNTILCITFGYMVLTAGRHVALFSLVAIPVLSSYLKVVFHKVGEYRNRRRLTTPFIILVLIGFVVMFIEIMSNLEEEQVYIIKNNYPVNATKYLVDNKDNVEVFNSYIWGGYLIWRFDSDQKVYIDGRADVYGAELVAHYRNIYLAKPGWKESLDRENIHLVLVEPDNSLAYALQISEEWELILEDDVSVLYRRK